jgi:hypothetical protein
MAFAAYDDFGTLTPLPVYAAYIGLSAFIIFYRAYYVYFVCYYQLYTIIYNLSTIKCKYIEFFCL